MNINIGENIRNLRKRKDITQEELADHLGISFQSISKWERGDGFPDITMLPDLADFFNISIDELIGADKTLGGGDFYNIYKQAHEYEIQGDYDKAIELLKDTLKKYPNHFDMTSKLASILLLKDNNSEEGKSYAQKALMLCERKLGGNISEKARATARASLCFLYDNIGEREKAKDLARRLPHTWEGREILYAELLEGQEYVDYLKRWLSVLLSIISDKIDSVYNNKRINVIDMLVGQTDIITPENKREIMNKIIDFLD
ncbi:MAG: helix-turn-helix domain-containing protein [Oscillospiraceae bacterium]|nr:helix-turn-helix domain-containing protein [Oscillospiraceae bacterium]